MRWLAVVMLILAVSGIRAEEKKLFEVEVRKDVAYRTEEGSDKVRHKLDLYLPKGTKNFPVFFFIHGGGWRQGNKNGFAAHGKTFAEHGIAFVATNYRLSPDVKHPEHIKDVAAAFAWVQKHLAKDGADLKRVFVSGHSAGGHLAALLAVDESYLKAHQLSAKNIAGVIPISGVFSVQSDRMEPIFGDEALRTAASPMTHVRGKLPPFLVFYADKELGALGKQAEAFGKSLKAKDSKVTVKMIAERDHGTIMRKASSAEDELTAAVFAFIANGSK